MSDLEFCIKLVEAVEKYSRLFNYQLPDYSNKHVTDKAWENVAKEVNNEDGKLITALFYKRDQEVFILFSSV